MKIERTKNASRNIVFGIILKISQIIIPFLMRTVIIFYMGVQYLGLNSLFTSILQVLNLVELGVGNAMVYSMYRPIAEDDNETICALMKLYRTYYRVIGGIIAVVGVALTPLMPHLIKSDLPSELNVYVLYLLNLTATVFSYWLFAYKNALFMAHQRIDVTSKVNLFTNTMQYILQFVVIIFTKDYYLYVMVALITQILTNLITAMAAAKVYPEYKAKGALDSSVVRDINRRIRDLFTAKIGAVVVNSADTVVISAFLGLTVLAIYQNYYFILSSIIGIVSTIFGACTAGIGNSIIVESKEKNFQDLRKFTFIIAWIAGFCSCCLLCLYQPFMRIWMNANEQLMLNFAAVICFCIYYFVYEINQLLNTYKDAAGMWHEDRFRPLVTAFSNFIMNLIMVQYWGIYGVILSTVLSMIFVGMPWLLHNLFTVLFEKKYLSQYIKTLFFYTLMSIITCYVCYIVCNLFELPDIPTLIIRAIICCIIPNIIFICVYCRSKEFKESILLVDRMTKGKTYLHKLLRRCWED